jgi:mannosyltransferase
MAAAPADMNVPAQVWTSVARRWGGRAFVVLVLLLAVALRVVNLTAQSLWADEGNSVRVTERPLDLVVAAARGDIHPPGYYVLLWGWVRLFGQGEAAVRALSAVFGVALVVLVYLAGWHWFGARVGWLAAFCAAVSPFQVVYSQEVRMYILVALLGAVATYSWGRWIVASGRGRLTWSVAYVLAAAAGLWTHYSFPVVLLALNVAWLVWWLRASHAVPGWRALSGWLGMHVIVLLLYAPWLPTAWTKVLSYGPISEQHPLAFVIAQSLKLLSVGETVPGDDLTRWLTVAMVGLAVFGAWRGLVRRGAASSSAAPARLSWAHTIALCLLVVAPMAMMVYLSLTGRPAYRPKFFLVASPAFCLLVGQGIAVLEQTPGSRRTMSSRLWLLLGLGMIGLASARSLRNYYLNPAYARADYRGIAEHIRQVGREGDAILLNAPNQWEVFTYYYRGPAPVYPLARSRPPREEVVNAELVDIAAQHRRLFALYWATAESDPQRLVERWLEANAFKAADVWYGDVRLVTYAVPEALEDVEMAYPLRDVRLGEAIALRGYTLAPERVERGDILQVTLFWEAIDVPAGRYKVFLHLVDEQGQIASQFDGEPGHGMNLTTGWRPEDGVFPDRYGVLVPQALAPGQYRLLVGMYDASGAPRLPVSIEGDPAGDVFVLAQVEIR